MGLRFDFETGARWLGIAVDRSRRFTSFFECYWRMHCGYVFSA